MIGYTSDVLAALSAHSIVARDFVWIVARDRETGDPVTDGYWSDVGSVSVSVVNPDTGSPVSRTFHGAGSLIQIDAIPRTSVMSVNPINVQLSQVAERVQDLVRGYDLKQARIQVFRGLFYTSLRTLVDPAYPRFDGYIDEVTIETPSENNAGGVSLRCVSRLVEITRSNPAVRSDEDQRRRSATDNFYQDVSTAGDLPIFWGSVSGKIPSKKGRSGNSVPTINGEAP